ncbi:hypothetical protein SAMN05443575_1296 [Jatrophihabitans endophyticus]|uniref:Tryptophan-associated transmembrane protein (Trp_oprn_chp) n=1 Tax=Jatrophihabitans endophyticus TaxID=1206085 RepID=A0A1M5GUG5_9ACTN|nr:hypothetical protein SAMN05443575_1296 [Jatrophihabitans endophyticus]
MLVGGLVALVVGTFLPWLRSGSATRNSYAAGGALRRILDPGGALGGALAVWPFVTLACAAAIALVLLGRIPAGAVVALLAACAAGSAGAVALAAAPRPYVRAAALGPAVTLAGAAVCLLGALACLLARHRHPDRSSR